jgi:hypothetical protein
MPPMSTAWIAQSARRSSAMARASSLPTRKSPKRVVESICQISPEAESLDAFVSTAGSAAPSSSASSKPCESNTTCLRPWILARMRASDAMPRLKAMASLAR